MAQIAKKGQIAADNPLVIRGRPPIPFNPSIADYICAEISSSNKSLATIVKQAAATYEAFPCLFTICQWLRTHDEFSTQYARAKESQADFLAEEMIDIADDASNDLTTDDEGRIVVNNANIQRARLQVDTRKWIAAKLKPKKYGERVQQEITGAGGESLNLTVTFVAPTPKPTPIDAICTDHVRIDELTY